MILMLILLLVGRALMAGHSDSLPLRNDESGKEDAKSIKNKVLIKGIPQDVVKTIENNSSSNVFSYEDIANDDSRLRICPGCQQSFEECQDQFSCKKICEMPCKHLIHVKCLADRKKKIGKNTCPICKTELKGELESVLEEKNTVFDFEKVQLKSFIEFISDLKELNYIPNPDTANFETSLSIREPLTVDQAYNVFLTVLEMSGFSHVKVGDVYKIVKKDARNTEPLPIFIGKASKELPDSDKPVRFVTFLKNLSVSDVDPLLKSLLNPGSLVIPLQTLNGLVITDRCFNIKSAMRIINELDNAGYQEVVSLIRLKETNASEVKEFLDTLMKKADGSILAKALGVATEGGIDYFPVGIKIIAEDRTNTLVLMGTKQSLQRVEDFIINFVDKGLKEVDTPFHIYECQYMDAKNLKQILDEVTKSDSTAGKFGGVRGGMKYFNNIKMEVDQLGNRLIASCADKHDWKYLYKTMVDLDKPQAQVSIETLMVEISNSDNKGLGCQMRNISDGSPIPGVNMQTTHLNSKVSLSNVGQNAVNLLGNIAKGVGGLAQGTTFLSFGSQDNIWSILQALNSQVRVSLIARPSIVIANRSQGTVSTASVQRITSEQAISDTSSAELIGWQDARAETRISYTPQINQEGLVNLKVDLSFQDFGASAENTISKSLSTNITVADGQVMVMGGFVKTKATEALSKTPVLSSIPILGWLFKNKGRTIEKSYTFFFVITTIQKPRMTPGINLYSKMKLHEAHDSVIDTVDTTWGKDPVHNWFFNASKEDYHHKVIDFANARYQPTTVDYKNDSYYRSAKIVGDVSGTNENNVHEIITFSPEGQKRIVKNLAVSASDLDKDPTIIRLSQNTNVGSLEEKRSQLRKLFSGGSVKHKESLKESMDESMGKVDEKAQKQFEKFLATSEFSEKISKSRDFLDGDYSSVKPAFKGNVSKHKDDLLNFLQDNKTVRKDGYIPSGDCKEELHSFLDPNTTYQREEKVVAGHSLDDKKLFIHDLDGGNNEQHLVEPPSLRSVDENQLSFERFLHSNQADNQNSLSSKREMLRYLVTADDIPMPEESLQNNRILNNDKQKMVDFLLQPDHEGVA